MQAGTDLKKIRRRVTRHYFQHGLWDIVIGVALVGWGLIIQYGFLTLTGVLSWLGVILVLFFVTWRLQRWLTPSRAGYIKYTGTLRYERIAITLSVVLGLGMITVFIYYVITLPEAYFSGWKVWFREYALFTLGILIALRHITIAYWWKVARWYVNAVLIFAAFATYHWLENPLGFWISGIIMLLVGILLLVRFLQKYPVAAEEGVNVSQ